MRRRIFVGDIQGCRAELEALLAKVAFDPARDALHPAGDVVNRGPDSLGTLRLLRTLDAQGVLGNHDLHLIRRAHGLVGGRPRDTLDTVLAADDLDALVSWLAAWPFAAGWPDVLLVHAGLSPAWTDPVAYLAGRDPLVGDADTDFATRVRYCSPIGQRPPRDDPPPQWPYRPWFEYWRGRDPRTVVFGHWARRGLVKERALRGLDTGCVWGGRLTAWIAEEDRLVNVPARKAYATY